LKAKTLDEYLPKEKKEKGIENKKQKTKNKKHLKMKRGRC